MNWRALVIAVAILPVSCGSAAPAADRVALALVHRTAQLDIPAGGMRRVKARPTVVYTAPGTRQRVVRREPHVEACFTKEVGEQICSFTKRVVNEPLIVLVGCEPVAEPIVRKPLCRRSCLRLPALNMEEAEHLAHALREGSSFPCIGPYREARDASNVLVALRHGKEVLPPAMVNRALLP